MLDLFVYLLLFVFLISMNGLFFKMACKKHYFTPNFLTATGYMMVISFFNSIVFILGNQLFEILKINGNELFYIFNFVFSVALLALTIHYVFKFLKNSHVKDIVCLKLSLTFHGLWTIFILISMLILKLLTS